MGETKVCKKCGRELPIEEFYRLKTMKDGHMNVCKECFMQQNKQYYQDNKEAKLEWQKQYYQEHKEERAEYMKQYRKDNREEILERKKQYRQEHKEERAEYQKQYRSTPMGRALYLVDAYKWKDKKYNRGECTLTAQWIIDNIFTSKCHWCEKTDWHKLGCDRIDNTKPHTPDNVIPCCDECNSKRGTKTYEEFLMYIKQKATE